MPCKNRKCGPAKDRKISDALDRLNQRQRMYVSGIAAGRTKKEAAIAAGCSESSANNAAAIIERAAVKKAFQGLIQQTIPVKKIIERLAEGLNAMETKCFVHEGGLIYGRPLVNFTERRLCQPSRQATKPRREQPAQLRAAGVSQRLPFSEESLPFPCGVACKSNS